MSICFYLLFPNQTPVGSVPATTTRKMSKVLQRGFSAGFFSLIHCYDYATPQTASSFFLFLPPPFLSAIRTLNYLVFH
ncbi:hypothetical protein GTNG_3090 [Geobacillus thermodenitrificans NG80-2]|uniref:Uncharacterized protein n=1 Tax=Geobacillus thermodenitrificans (strain NG80-2) TaxID=420246 RepID=A4ISY1_GEOTN|nr:hypothetical protein GTNG_3090 [Geobacillus thermodenitrificans NG80-2]